MLKPCMKGNFLACYPIATEECLMVGLTCHVCLQDAAVLARQKASVLIESILQSHYKRTALIQSYRSVITSFKSGKDSASFNSNKRSLDDKFKTLGEKVSQLGKDLQLTDADSAAKVWDGVGIWTVNGVMLPPPSDCPF